MQNFVMKLLLQASLPLIMSTLACHTHVVLLDEFIRQ
jgi:hypothetical protein